MCISSFDTGKGNHLVLQVNRSSRNFSRRDAQVFEFLAQHARVSYQQLQRQEAIERSVESFASGYDPESYFWLSLGPLLYKRNASRNAHRILGALFPRSGAGFQLPPELRTQAEAIISKWNACSKPIDQRISRFSVVDSRRNIDFEFRQIDTLNYRLSGLQKSSKNSVHAQRESPTGIECLSSRESETIHWVRQGKTNPEIAIILGIRPKTVEKHFSSVLEKLGLKNRSAVITQIANA